MPNSSERQVSRRHARRTYLTERVGFDEHRRLRSVACSAEVELLTAARAAGSALRRRLREEGLDPRLARLMLVLDGERELRMSDVAWRLSISQATASRWLDRAEAQGFIDKLYRTFDRRCTWARTTRRGREFRARVLRLLTTLETHERPAGPAYGARGNQSYFDPYE